MPAAAVGRLLECTPPTDRRTDGPTDRLCRKGRRKEAQKAKKRGRGTGKQKGLRERPTDRSLPLSLPEKAQIKAAAAAAAKTMCMANSLFLCLCAPLGTAPPPVYVTTFSSPIQRLSVKESLSCMLYMGGRRAGGEGRNRKRPPPPFIPSCSNFFWQCG